MKLHLLTILLASNILGCAYDQSTQKNNNIIVPKNEKMVKLKVGPRETKGISGVKILGSIDLGKEFAGLQGFILRARKITIEPGGKIAAHKHDNRPGVALGLEGSMTEYRSQDFSKGILLNPGDVSFEETGLVHWWKNEGNKPAVGVVIDIVEE